MNSAQPMSSGRASLPAVLEGVELRAELQPLLDLRSRGFHGYEALIRGPAGSQLERPDQLFALARSQRCLAEFDCACARVGITRFAELRLDGQLFVNVTEALFDSGWFAQEQTIAWLQALGLAPARLVLELLESDTLSIDSAAIGQAQHLRDFGYGLALDDLGQGFGRFALWKRLRPRYLKIDRMYIANLANDPLKAAFVQSMLLLAEASQSVVVAEGVESERDLLTLRELGVTMAQGYYIARPQPLPGSKPAGFVRDALDRVQPALHALASRGSIEQTAMGLARRIHPVSADTRLNLVLQRLEHDPDLMSVPVVDPDGKALGIINRYVLADRLFRPHVRDLLGNKPCSLVMSSDVLRLDIKATLQQASALIADSSYRHATEGVLIVEDQSYRGLLLVGDLLRLITEFQVQSARYANPLTLLPGNVPINDCIDSWLREGHVFAAAYCDIDNFKPLNDRCGYRVGDEIILLLGELLKTRLLNQGFVGHIGGDDFVVLSRLPNWEAELDAVLVDFGTGIARFFDETVLREGGYWAESRRGEAMFFPIPTLSIGALVVHPGSFDSHREVSNVLADLKKTAKHIPGSNLFVDRRNYNPACLVAGQ